MLSLLAQVSYAVDSVTIMAHPLVLMPAKVPRTVRRRVALP